MSLQAVYSRFNMPCGQWTPLLACGSSYTQVARHTAEAPTARRRIGFTTTKSFCHGSTLYWMLVAPSAALASPWR